MNFGTSMGLLTLGSFIAFVLVLLYAWIARPERMAAAARMPLDDEDDVAARRPGGTR